MKSTMFPWYFIIMCILIENQAALSLGNRSVLQPKQKSEDVLAGMQVVCLSDAILLKVHTNRPFNGMVYAKDEPHTNSCVSEYNSSRNLTFRLPLKACGTLFVEADDGIEYFNTIVLQPHKRLMTNQGKGYNVRCKYQIGERTLTNSRFNVSASLVMANGQLPVSAPLLATASMPSCTMKIFRSGHDDVAEAVKVGDKLIMIIEIDQQEMYGMRVSNCLVRDGLNLLEQQLIDDSGCPTDELIMPKFEYSNSFTRASVSFPAHKFPHTGSIYYQCNIRLCISNNDGCKPSQECPSAREQPAFNSSPPDLSRLRPSTGLTGREGAVPASSRPAASPSADFVISGRTGGAISGASGSSSSSSSSSSIASNRRQTTRRKRSAESSSNQRPGSGNSLGAGRRPGGLLSFDVYSGLHVSDLDADASESGAETGRLKLIGRAQPGAPNRERPLPLAERGRHQEPCWLSSGRATIGLLGACLASLALTVAVALRVGLHTGKGRGQPGRVAGQARVGPTLAYTLGAGRR